MIKGRTGACNVLIAKGNDPNAMANSGGTSLMFAAGAGHMEAAAVLIDAGADVNAKLKATSEFLDQVGHVFVFLPCLLCDGAECGAISFICKQYNRSLMAYIIRTCVFCVVRDFLDAASF